MLPQEANTPLLLVVVRQLLRQTIQKARLAIVRHSQRLPPQVAAVVDRALALQALEMATQEALAAVVAARELAQQAIRQAQAPRKATLVVTARQITQHIQMVAVAVEHLPLARRQYQLPPVMVVMALRRPFLAHLSPMLAVVVAVVVQQPLIPAVVEQVDRVAVVLARLNRLHLHQIMVLPVPQTLAEAGAVHQMAAAQAAQAALAS